MKNEVWTHLFGYEVNREMKEIVMNEIAATGDPIEKVVARYTLPFMAILSDPDGKFEYEGQRVTPSEWEQLNPLGTYGKIVIIKTDDC